MTGIDSIRINDGVRDRYYHNEQIIDILDGGPTGTGSTPRLVTSTTYRTDTTSPTVHYTALHPDGSTLTARTTANISLAPGGLYSYTQDTSGIDDFIAKWDEGTVSDYASEWIVVDTNGQTSTRLLITATYRTDTVTPTVYYTALNTDNTVLTARTTLGISLDPAGLYAYEQDITGVTDFIAIWDEGVVDSYASEWIVVDT